MSLEAILTQLLMGLTVGVNLVLVATGLTLVFGMMGVINFAHSALFMLGAYAALMVANHLGSFWLGLAIAPPAIALLGAAVERWLLRPLRERYPLSHLLPLLLTFGLSLFFEGSAKVLWGADIVSLDKPAPARRRARARPDHVSHLLALRPRRGRAARGGGVARGRADLARACRSGPPPRTRRWPPCSASTPSG